MEPINNAVATNLKNIREQRRISLDALAKMTGVSKSMLAQIEHGTANPTISTVWKIANGLKVSFSELIYRQEQDFETVRIDTLPMLTEDDGRFRNYPVFPYDAARNFEIYCIELDPGAFLQADAHLAGTQEFITVFEGEVEIVVNDQTLTANTDCAVRFRADLPHSYKNPGVKMCRLSMTISYVDRP